MGFKVKRHPLKAGDAVTFEYDAGHRHVYVTQGEHPKLVKGKPTELKPGESLVIEAEEPVTVSVLYV